jgi:hypothetical protein
MFAVSLNNLLTIQVFHCATKPQITFSTSFFMFLKSNKVTFLEQFEKSYLNALFFQKRCIFQDF